MINTSDDRFKFFVPFEIEKGIDNAGAEVMKIKGVASTNRKDSQGEVLDVNGFDLTDFSVINWNHKGRDDASAIIGEPTKATIVNNKLEIEGILYPEMAMAKAVWSLMKAYKNSPSGKRLGLSIEGKATERDVLNPKHIRRAKVTGVAICPHPINGDTTVDLLQKSFIHDDWQFDKSEMDYIEKAKDFWSLIDSDKKFKDFVIKKASLKQNDQEALSSIPEEQKQELLKAYTAEGNLHVSKESVEHDTSKILSKSDVYEKIFDYFGPVNPNNAKQVFTLVETISTMNKKPITDDTLKKAFEILNLASTTISKSSDSDDDDDDDEEKEYEGNEGLEKAKKFAKKAVAEGTEEDEVVKALKKGGLDVSKAKTIYKSCVDDASRDKEGGNMTTLMKSQDALLDIMKGFGSSLDQKFSAMSDILKSQSDSLNIQSQQIEDLHEINKGLTAEIENIGSQPLKRKSIPNVREIDRFEKSEDGTTTFQLSNDQSRRMLVSHINDISGINTGDPTKTNMQLARVAQDIELSKSISGAGVSLLKAFKIEVLK